MTPLSNNCSTITTTLTRAGSLSELANDIAKEIVTGLEEIADYHLNNYSKYTLASNLDLERETDSRFFELIGSLKNVSALGRKLIELAPKLNSSNKYHQTNDTIRQYDSKSVASDCSSQTRLKRPDSLASIKSQNDSIWFANNKTTEQDATSEDLLASLVESSSTDDFLVLSSSLDSITSRDMILLSLICIKAHDCFTLSHDIQGVAMVLKRVKFIILNILAPKDEMELVKKLLTSIGRYNEMNYVFDLFKDRNQFEMLLSKGVEKTPELRIALFNYVKKNPEFYALVTLNFSMFCEIAESLETNAVKRLNRIFKSIATGSGTQTLGLSLGEGCSQKISAIGSNPSHKKQPSDPGKVTQHLIDSKVRCPAHLEEQINVALIELVDAADCFAKAGRYKRSNRCGQKAKLIALQLSLLNGDTKDQSVWLLHLKTEQLNDTIQNFKSFQQAAIVAEAYDYHLAWSQALFLNVILYSNFMYLKEFIAEYSFSNSLVSKLTTLYRQYMSTNREMISKPTIESVEKAFKHLLSHLPDIEEQCKIYTQCQFDDAREQLINQDPFVQAHLRDLNLV